MNGQKKQYESWVPHVTLAYSTSAQPAAPIIATLGRKLPAHGISVDRVDLIVQEGAETPLELAVSRRGLPRLIRRGN
jgi:2'-5' RNA ligase